MYIGRQSKEEIFDDFAEYVSWGKVQVYRAIGFDFVPGRREGCYIWDLEGDKKLLDCRSSGGVFDLGHRPEVTINALRGALEELDCGDHLMISEHRARLAKKLAGLMPGDIKYTVYCVGGGEAIDLALKLARGYTGRTGVVSAMGGYHGHTGFALAAGDAKWREKFGPGVPGFSQVPFDDIEAIEEEITEDTAAVILETYPATGGVQVPAPDYFLRLRELCDQKGALWIDDEVQTGLGRCGYLWAVEEYNVVPDIIVLGKGTSGGIYPLTVTCIREKLETFFREDPFIHISTCGGTDLGCVVTSAMLDVVSQGSFLEHVQEMGGLFAEGLDELGERHPDIQKGYRQKGLMIGIDLAEEALGVLMAAEMYRSGVLALFADNHPQTLIIMPPLIISPEDVSFVLRALDSSYQGVRERWENIEEQQGL